MSLPTIERNKSIIFSTKDFLNDKGQIKRPLNAFMIFAKQFRHNLLQTMPESSNTEISKLLGMYF